MKPITILFTNDTSDSQRVKKSTKTHKKLSRSVQNTSAVKLVPLSPSCIKIKLDENMKIEEYATKDILEQTSQNLQLSVIPVLSNSVWP